jgi:Zn-dependent metalloprotease
MRSVRADCTHGTTAFQISKHVTAKLRGNHDDGEIFSYQLQQIYKGVSVYAVGFNVVTNAQGDVTALTNTYVDIEDNFSTTPSISSSRAETIVREAITAERGSSPEDSDISLSAKGLTIYTLHTLYTANVKLPALVWLVNASSDSFIFDRNYFVDQNGTIINMIDNIPSIAVSVNDMLGNPRNINIKSGDVVFELIDEVRDIGTYTSNNTDQTGNTIVTSNSATQWTDLLAISAHSNTAATYDFYKDTLGWESIDGKGMEIHSFIHNSMPEYNGSNAVWDNGKKMLIYGNANRYAACHDIVPRTTVKKK